MTNNGIISQQAQRGLRVLHCLRAPVGGLFRHVADLAEAQYQMGFEVGILCADEPDDGITTARLEALRPFCSLGVTRIALGRMPGLSDLKALLSAGHYVALLNPDVVHGHGAKGGLISRLVNAPKEIVRIYTPHGGTIHFSPSSIAGRVFGFAERVMMSRTQGLIFESGYARSVFEERFGVGARCASVVYNGVSASEFDPIALAPNASDFLFLGELRELKGIFTLLDAFAPLAASRQASLSVVGDGPDAEAFKARVRELQLERSVHMHGVLPAREGFCLGRIVVMPSHKDSFPYVALEAAAAGKPLIATRTGGIPEIFGPFSDQLVEPHSVEALREKLCMGLDEPRLGIELAENLREFVRDEFSVQQMAADVTKVYQSALNSEEMLFAKLTSASVPNTKLDAVNE